MEISNINLAQVCTAPNVLSNNGQKKYIEQCETILNEVKKDSYKHKFNPETCIEKAKSQKSLLNNVKNFSENALKTLKKHPVVAGLAAAVTIPTVIATTKKVVENLKLKKMVKKTNHEIKKDSNFLQKVYEDIKSGKIKTIKQKEAD